MRPSLRLFSCVLVGLWSMLVGYFKEKGQLDLIKIRSYYVNLAQRRRRQVAAVNAEKSSLTDGRAGGAVSARQDLPRPFVLPVLCDATSR